MLNNAINDLNTVELDAVAGANECTQDIATIAGAVATVIGVAAAPFTFGASLAIAAGAGLVAGVSLASAQTTCS